MARVPTAEIRALAGLIDDLDYYQLLEVKPDVQLSEIKKAYYKASRRYHPDAYRTVAGGDRQAVETVSKRVTEAYQVLRDPRRRRAYDNQLGADAGASRIQLVEAEAQASAQSQAEHTGATPNGRKFFTLAKQCIDREDRDGAIRNLKMALTFEPKNEGFKAKLVEVRGS